MKNDFARYSSQIKLPGFGKKAQEKLSKAKVLIIGAGGLGCPVSMYLASAGVGTLGIVDFDTVALSNLNRQILYGESDSGKLKVTIAVKNLRHLNSQINIIPIAKKISKNNILEIINSYDMVVDCSDNFDTRYLLNDACVILGLPLVYGAIFKYEGQVSVFNVKNNDGTRSPNYRDLFKFNDKLNVPNCSDVGVLPTLTGVIGCIQASEVIKYLTGIGEILKGKLLIFDTLTMQSTIINLLKSTSAKLSKVQGNQVKVTTISVADFKKLVKRNYQLVDVRTHEEHNNFNIGGLNYPLDEILNGQVKLTYEKPIIFYCRSGGRSNSAASFVIGKNPGAEVFSLEDGIISYQTS